MKCPLCSSEQIKLIDVVDSRVLTKKYERLTNENFSTLFVKEITLNECQNCKLRFFYPQVAGEESFYNTLQKYDWYYMKEKEEYREASKYIDSTDKVLDVGCGKGDFAKYLSTIDYVGLEYSKNAQKMALKNGVKIINKMIQDYADKYPKYFDVVVSFQVLEHVSDPESFLESMLKSLKSDGKMIIAVPNEDSFLKYASNNILNLPPHHVTRWSEDSLKFIAKKYNLNLIGIYRERLQPIHKQWYLKVLIENSIIKSKLLDNSFRRKILSVFARLLSKIFIKGFQDEFLPNGHTIMAIYEKNRN